jgi:hypothetical protein
LRRCKSSCQQTDRRRFHISLDAGDLSRESQAWGAPSAATRRPTDAANSGTYCDECRRAARSGRSRAPESYGRSASARHVFSLVWNPDHVPQRAERIVLAELHNGKRPPLVLDRAKPTGFIGPKRSVSSPRAAITSMGRQPRNRESTFPTP